MLHLVRGALATEIHGERFLLCGDANHQEIT